LACGIRLRRRCGLAREQRGRFTQRTAGQALFDLCVIRDDDGGRPGLWLLTKYWFVSLGSVLSLLNS